MNVRYMYMSLDNSINAEFAILESFRVYYMPWTITNHGGVQVSGGATSTSFITLTLDRFNSHALHNLRVPAWGHVGAIMAFISSRIM